MMIGSHTCTHALLDQEDVSVVTAEVTHSRLRLQHELGVPVEHIAYPDGRFDETALAAAHDAGYRFGYTTCAHRHPRHPLLSIPRRMFWETSCLDARGHFSGAVMGCQAAGLFTPLASCVHAAVAG